MIKNKNVKNMEKIKNKKVNKWEMKKYKYELTII